MPHRCCSRGNLIPKARVGERIRETGWPESRLCCAFLKGCGVTGAGPYAVEYALALFSRLSAVRFTAAWAAARRAIGTR
jgi:hypothetical protein